MTKYEHVERIHIVKRNIAREFRMAHTMYLNAPSEMSLARYRQARAMITYIGNIEYALMHERDEK